MKFFLSALKTNTSRCIIWPFGTRKGYGQIRIGGKDEPVHREVLKRTVGLPPTASHEAAHEPSVCHNKTWAWL